MTSDSLEALLAQIVRAHDKAVRCAKLSVRGDGPEKYLAARDDFDAAIARLRAALEAATTLPTDELCCEAVRCRDLQWLTALRLNTDLRTVERVTVAFNAARLNPDPALSRAASLSTSGDASQLPTEPSDAAIHAILVMRGHFPANRPKMEHGWPFALADVIRKELQAAYAVDASQSGGATP